MTTEQQQENQDPTMFNREDLKDAVREVLQEEGFSRSGDDTQLRQDVRREAVLETEEYFEQKAREYYEQIPGVIELMERSGAAEKMVADSPVITITRAEDTPTK